MEMKAIDRFLVGLFLICCVGITNAQGIRAGYNFSSVSTGDLPVSIDSNNGWYVGIYKEFPFLVKDFLYLAPELQYSRQGFSASNNDIDLDYINVPIMAKIYIVKIVSLETGPQFGFKITDSGTSTYTYNTFDPAWAVGASVNLPFNLAVTGRYIGSFNEVVKDYSAKNKIFQLGLAFKFK